MRYTPFLDRMGVTFKDDVPDHAVNIIDSALHAVSSMIEWGEWQGKKRKPCEEQPILLAGMPIGMYHCPNCGMMVVAGMPHTSPQEPEDQDPMYPLGPYEREYGQPWPPGYEEEE